jgi:dimethylargininase
MLQAIMRPVSSTLDDCELEHLNRTMIDVDKARAQHSRYRRVLEQLGIRVHTLRALDDHPDACFVEDPAVPLGNEWALLRMGSLARRGEETTMRQWLNDHNLRFADMSGEAGDDAVADGGDVLLVERTAYVGLSSRTNVGGLEFLRAVGQRNGIEVWPIRVRGTLHLKSACTVLDPDTLIGNLELLGEGRERLKERFDIVQPASGEASACNVLAVGRTVLVPSGCPRTADRLASRGLNVVPVEIGEFEKAEAGLTCLARVF